MELDYGTSTGMGKRARGGQGKTLCTPGPRRRSRDPASDWARLPCECLGVPVEAWAASGLHGVRGTRYKSWEPQKAGVSHFEGGCQPTAITLTIVWPEVRLQGGNTAPTYQQNTGLKIYQAWPWPPEQDPLFPTASSSHEEASTSLVASSIREKTEWKP